MYEKTTDQLKTKNIDLLQNENISKAKIISFELKDKTFDVFFSLLPNTQPAKDESSPVRDFEIQIEQQGNDQLMKIADGMIGGTIEPSKSGSGYVVKNLYKANTQIEKSPHNSNQYTKKINHTPGLITETIRQLILQGVVTKWNSAYNLSKGGEDVYKKLANDPQLEVESRSKSFVVTRAVTIGLYETHSTNVI